MLQYFTIVSVICALISCCTGADDTTTDNSEKQANTKEDNKNQNKQNNLKLKKDTLNNLKDFLKEIKKSNTRLDKKTIDSLDLLIVNVGNASNMINKIITNKYNNSRLKIAVKNLNEELKRIDELYNSLFSLPNQESNSNLHFNAQTLNGNVHAITHLDCRKKTRNESNVITDPLNLKNNDENELNINETKCIIVDLSNPVLTPEQVEEYYSSYNGNNNVIEQGTIPIRKSHDDNSIGAKKLTDEKYR